MLSIFEHMKVKFLAHIAANLPIAANGVDEFVAFCLDEVKRNPPAGIVYVQAGMAIRLADSVLVTVGKDEAGMPGVGDGTMQPTMTVPLGGTAAKG